ncbi:MAG: ABC transporter ATP-binding protein [Candidatus Bathyarchaeia archaeon]
MSQSLLELKNVTKIFSVGGYLVSKRTIKALDSISFAIPSDKPVIIALVGESGSGKTTLAKIILGLLKPSSGEVLYKGKKLSDWLKKNRFDYLKEVQPVFQDPYSTYNPFYRVERVLEVAVKKFKLASTKAERRKIILKAMEEMGLRPEDILGRYPHQLSGGERQRLMLVRLLLIKPKLIVADEPVSMIDVSLRAIFLDHLASFKNNLNTSCLYITHDLNTASYISDRIIVLCRGRIVEDGPKEDLIKEPLHPYTRLLVNSIPIPDPKHRWVEKVELRSIESFKEPDLKKCIFSERCPLFKEICGCEAPTLFEVGRDRRVACFQYC